MVILWIKQNSSICKTIRLKRIVMTKYVLTVVYPHMFFFKAKYQCCFQVSTTHVLWLIFKACVLFVVQNIRMHKVLSNFFTSDSVHAIEFYQRLIKSKLNTYQAFVVIKSLRPNTYHLKMMFTFPSILHQTFD